ncbi:MAG: ribonuclease P protein component [Bacteroidales bacterium]|nr:ribonuclease P protein component [Bacteroidales bacterium]
MNHTFPKTEKLCGQLHIKQLYATGKHFVVWPLRITYAPAEDDTTQVLIWASKSLFKHAVDRNRLRRQMRETYRLQKHLLGNAQFRIAVNYIDRQKQDYATIERAMRKALTRLAGGNPSEKVRKAPGYHTDKAHSAPGKPTEKANQTLRKPGGNTREALLRE